MDSFGAFGGQLLLSELTRCFYFFFFFLFLFLFLFLFWFLFWFLFLFLFCFVLVFGRYSLLLVLFFTVIRSWPPNLQVVLI